MIKIASIAAAAAAVFMAATPALAKQDCDKGFRKHMQAMSIYTDTAPVDALADAIRRSVDAYASCKSGDSFSPYGIWDKVLAEMKEKSGK